MYPWYKHVSSARHYLVMSGCWRYQSAITATIHTFKVYIYIYIHIYIIYMCVCVCVRRHVNTRHNDATVGVRVAMHKPPITCTACKPRATATRIAHIAARYRVQYPALMFRRQIESRADTILLSTILVDDAIVTSCFDYNLARDHACWRKTMLIRSTTIIYSNLYVYICMH